MPLEQRLAHAWRRDLPHRVERVTTDMTLRESGRTRRLRPLRLFCQP